MLFLFSNKQKIIKILTNKKLLSMVQELEINVVDKLRVELPSNVWVDVDEKPFYMGIRDIRDKHKFYMYKISKPIVKGNVTEVTGINIGYDELRGKGYVKDRRFNNNSVEYVANAILEDTGWELGFVDSNLVNVSTNFYYVNKLKALSKLLEITQAEIRFRVETTGNRIISKRLDIYEKLGRDRGKRFAYGSKLLSVEKEEDSTGLYTALVGRGKGEEVQDDEGNPTGGYGRKITFEDIEWDTENGDPVNKPIGQEFVEIPEMTELYGFPDGSPRIDIIEFSDVEDEELLLDLTYRELVERSRPKVQFKSTVANIGEIEEGETVSIIRDDIGIRYKTRVYKILVDHLNSKKTEISLGDKIGHSISSEINRIDNIIDRTEESLIEISYRTADGKNRVFRSTEAPTENMAKNDIWYRPVGEGEVEMYMWNGDIWELQAYSADQLGGTVDFANVNAINLNANAMTTGTLEGGRVKWDLDTGHFLIGNDEEDYVFKWDGEKVSIVLDNGRTIEEEIEESFENAPIYTWIKYSDNQDGSNMNDNPDSTYIGISTGNSSAIPSDDPNDYNWTRVRGEDGRDGEDGINPPIWEIGEDGYWYVDGERTNQRAVGVDGDDGEDGTDWIIGEDGYWYENGVKTDKKAIGEDGERGPKGEDGYTPIKGIDYFDGSDGESSYLWIRYSQNEDGNPMTPDPTEAIYIGVATTNTPNPPQSYQDYDWSLIKGEDGIEGADGEDGRTSYLHIKYSDDGGNTFTGNNGEDVGKYIGMYVDFEEGDSDDPNDYIWNRIQADVDIYEGDVEPEEAEEGLMWLDTSLEPPIFKVYQDGEWVGLGTDLTEIMETISGIGDDIGELQDDLGNMVEASEFAKMQKEFEERNEQIEIDRQETIESIGEIDESVVSIETELGNTVRKWSFLNSNITHSDNGILISNDDKSMRILISNDRISFVGNDEEVAFISGSTMQINHGIFVKTLTVDKYKFEQIRDTDIMQINFVGED